MEKPSIPKGTRDFGPAAMGKRQFIFNTIRSVYQKYGFQPLETPSMENLSVLTGKYGEEGDQLLFRIQDSEDFLDEKNSFVISNSGTELREFLQAIDLQVGQNKIIDYSDSTRIQELKNIIQSLVPTVKFNNQDFEDELPLRKLVGDYSHWILDAVVDWYTRPVKNPPLDWWVNRNGAVSTLISKILRDRTSEKGLRYDLTVPFARYVVMNRGVITFPFKRYQIQPVWRADRPQKGRYREFYQCDADVVGTTSLLCEAEIVMMIREVMKGLGIQDFTIKINHRGVLKGIADSIEATGKETALYVAIDKLDKIGKEGVSKELSEVGFDSDKIDLLFTILNTAGSNEEKRKDLSSLFKSENGQKGLLDLKTVFDLLEASGSDQNNLEFDISLARGLSYYTGCIFEVKVNNVAIGSVSGGGRYDNLTSSFGDKENLSGVGISFGVDRLYDVLEELQLFPKEIQRSSKVLICFLDTESMRYGLKVLAALRASGIASELYPDESKLKKQLDYANKKMIPFAIVIGEEERKEGKLMLKNMDAGTQEKVSVEEIIKTLKV